MNGKGDSGDDCLSLTQRIAIEAVQRALNQANQQLAAAQQAQAAVHGQWVAVMTECGLDPTRNWSIGPDGAVEEMHARASRPAAPVAPAQNGRNVGAASN